MNAFLEQHGRMVIVSRAGIALFNSRWPCSTLRDSRHYWFEFDENGNLIDTDVPEHDDGPAATALAEDCKAWLDGTTPEWIPQEQPRQTLEASLIARAPMGVSETEASGGWRAIVAKKPSGESRVLYFHQYDHTRSVDALRVNAKQWLDACTCSPR